MGHGTLEIGKSIFHQFVYCERMYLDNCEVRRNSGSSQIGRKRVDTKCLSNINDDRGACFVRVALCVYSIYYILYSCISPNKTAE